MIVMTLAWLLAAAYTLPRPRAGLLTEDAVQCHEGHPSCSVVEAAGTRCVSRVESDRSLTYCGPKE